LEPLLPSPNKDQRAEPFEIIIEVLKKDYGVSMVEVEKPSWVLVHEY